MLSVLLKLCLYLHLWISIGVSFWHFQFRKTTPRAREKNIVIGPKMKPSSGWASHCVDRRRPTKTKEAQKNSACDGSVFPLFFCLIVLIALTEIECTLVITIIGYIVWNYTTIDIATKSHQQVNNGLPLKNYFHPAKWPQTIQKIAYFCSYNIGILQYIWAPTIQKT